MRVRVVACIRVRTLIDQWLRAHEPDALEHGTQGISPLLKLGRTLFSTCASESGSFSFFIRFSTAHDWFLCGAAHTRPVQSVSCHGTRTDT